MAIALGFKGGILGIGEETEYGTPANRTVFVEMNNDNLAITEERLHSGAIPALYTDDDEVQIGTRSVGGDVQLEMRYEGFEKFLKHGLGTANTVEVASFTVSNSNKYIDFKEDGGSEKSVAVDLGTYKMGTSSGTAGTLCAKIKSAIESQSSKTYTVSFNTTTKKLTIAVSNGTVQFLWKTGTHGSDNTDDHIGTLIGFNDTSDSQNANSITANNAVVAVYDHTFTLTDDLPIGLSIEVDRDIQSFLYSGCKINTMGLSLETNGYLLLNLGIIGKDEETVEATTPILQASNMIYFVHGKLIYNSIEKNVKSFNFTLNNKLSNDRIFLKSYTIAEPQRTGKLEITGNFTTEFDSVTEYNDFRNATSRALVFVCEDLNAIKGSLYRTLTINFPSIKLTGKTPTISNAGVIMQELPFKAYAIDSNTREFNIVLRNTNPSV